jgi:hypothetical protein
MTIRLLLIIHAFITFIAAIVLIVSPGFIPRAAGIGLAENSYLICYLLAAAELAIAWLSFAARNISDAKFLRLLSIAFIIFHFSTAILELVYILDNYNVNVLANLVIRLILVILFFFYGVKRTSGVKNPA